jgi:uncharacterized protein (TIGR02147 family)
MVKTVFDYTDYKRYIDAIIRGRAASGRGFKAQIADAIGCQRGFISQVLQGEAHFSLEQGMKFNRLAAHPPGEGHFFLLLIQYNRAGSRDLKDYFRKQMKEIISQRLVLKNRLENEKCLPIEDQSRYYSAWYYSAIRVSVAIPTLQTQEALAQRFQLPIALVSETLSFLVSRGMVEQKGDRFFPATHHMHLGNDSTFTAKLHTNWRVKTLSTLEQERPKDLHYSCVMTVAEDDVLEVKSLLVNYIEELQKRVMPSKEEVVYAFCLDFFEL